MIGLVRLRGDERGQTIVELMVVIMLLSILMGVFYSFLFGGQRAADDGREWLELNQTARLILERMARELREADKIISVGPPDGATSIFFESDFDASGTYTDGNYEPHVTSDEQIHYEYQGLERRMMLWTEANPDKAVLAGNIVLFRFDYLGSDPSMDQNGDGTVTWQEIDATQGNKDGQLNGIEPNLITSMVIEMTVGLGNQRHDYRTIVEMRNLFK